MKPVRQQQYSVLVSPLDSQRKGSVTRYVESNYILTRRKEVAVSYRTVYLNVARKYYHLHTLTNSYYKKGNFCSFDTIVHSGH